MREQRPDVLQNRPFSKIRVFVSTFRRGYRHRRVDAVVIRVSRKCSNAKAI